MTLGQFCGVVRSRVTEELGHGVSLVSDIILVVH